MNKLIKTLDTITNILIAVGLGMFIVVIVNFLIDIL